MNTIFYGYDSGCEFCTWLEFAKKVHWCPRGKQLGYIKCGTTIEFKCKPPKLPNIRNLSCPPHDLEDNDTYFKCRKCGKTWSDADVVGD